MRCRFCHNPHLVFDPDSQPEIPEDEVMDFLESRRGRLEGVVVSGGEPTVHSDLSQFLKRVKEAGFDVKLDTNGTHPHLVKSLVTLGWVDALGFDYKHLLKDYKKTVCVAGHSPAAEAMLRMIPELDIPVDVRTTVHKLLHSPEDIVAMRAELDRFGVVEWTIQQFNNVEVIDDRLNEVESYSDIELQEIVEPLHDTSIRG